jgi:hypothetical protein
MDRMIRRWNWRFLAALGLGLCLVAMLVHPALAHGSPVAAFVLLPMILFGLVLVPLFFWPPSGLGQRVAARPAYRTNLFQRPPPSCKN